jgi:hypothetical protein
LDGLRSICDGIDKGNWTFIGRVPFAHGEHVVVSTSVTNNRPIPVWPVPDLVKKQEYFNALDKPIQQVLALEDHTVVA